MEDSTGDVDRAVERGGGGGTTRSGTGQASDTRGTASGPKTLGGGRAGG